jgi:hypothetical protein
LVAPGTTSIVTLSEAMLVPSVTARVST